ncbi:hypothetical protein CMV_003446 [Castanea mollissima]|uniref:Uncharacterized protein n=1 Tax=Castanea mollissima TaxID=60419 RepID=A0A8J4VW74_9ROSI|nr:hypothetical protein CMV_003446 [Castanea mollissima]
MWRFCMQSLLECLHKRDYGLARLTECYKLVAGSGSHGKSTTASMLAYVLKAMGDDLTAVIGARVPQAARQRFPFKAIWVVFQPHSYRHLEELKDEFATALCDADHVVVTAETVVDELVVQISKELNRQIVFLTRIASATLARNGL